MEHDVYFDFTENSQLGRALLVWCPGTSVRNNPRGPVSGLCSVAE